MRQAEVVHQHAILGQQQPSGESLLDRVQGVALGARPVLFAYHGNLHVRGYKEEGTITTPFDMAVLNELDRFHLALDALARLPQQGERGAALQRDLQATLQRHHAYIRAHGEDMPEVTGWRWRW